MKSIAIIFFGMAILFGSLAHADLWDDQVEETFEDFRIHTLKEKKGKNIEAGGDIT